MKIKSTAKWIGSLALAAALIVLTPTRGAAQGLMELEATSAISSEMSSGSVSSGVGNEALKRAQGLKQGNTQAGAPPTTQPPAPQTPPQTPPPTSGTPAPNQPTTTAPAPVLPTGQTITVITGTRVFDAITGSLLDEPIQKKVPQSEAEKYFDDGTHGDVTPNDGEMAKVDERKDALGMSNQRFKEQLVKALVVADGMTPLQYFGIPIASTERSDTAPRNRAWRLVPVPEGGPGFTFREVQTSATVTVPNYRQKEQEKDANIKSNWAVRFLQEFRTNKDDMTSQFYSLYIPLPPQPPTVAPPFGQQWTPFSDPQALMRAEESARQSAMNPMGNMPGMPGMGGPGGGGGIEGGV
ncbi:hypothetical protein LLG95_14495 [bacterium]|nr:hypothetical protein [bacterium]